MATHTTLVVFWSQRRIGIIKGTFVHFQMKVYQDHIIRILDCKKIPYEMVDIGDPNFKEEKLFMQGTLKLKDDDLIALPPQIFNEKTYRGVSRTHLHL